MIGRRAEQDSLEFWLHSGRSEFVVVYGRRRVGKTYLIEQYFKGRFAFQASGIAAKDRRTQLRAFHAKLIEYGSVQRSMPTDWFEAFERLKGVLCLDGVARDPQTGRRVVFIDEMPWLDTPRSNFKAALELFWNSWASMQDDIMLIACGSATSWLTRNLLKGTQGLYRRVTGSISLQPFTLGMCEQLLRSNGVEMSRGQIAELYLVFGGIPYYLNLIRRGLSPAQNVDLLCFAPGCMLEGEFDMLFRSLFNSPEGHIATVEGLAKKKEGLTFSEMKGLPGMPTGASLNRALEDLELCGFIRCVPDFSKRAYGGRYQLSDPFCRFHLRFLKMRLFDSWANHVGTPSYVSWRGNAFEFACMSHLDQIKRALGISGVETRTSSWQSKAAGAGAQIDLVIDRRDGIVDLCETKFTDSPYVLDKDECRKLATKREAFRGETRTKKALHTVLISMNGVARNAYSGEVQAVIDGDSLFD